MSEILKFVVLPRLQIREHCQEKQRVAGIFEVALLFLQITLYQVTGNFSNRLRVYHNHCLVISEVTLTARFTVEYVLLVCFGCRIFFGLSSYRTENSVFMFRLSNFFRPHFVPHRKQCLYVQIVEFSWALFRTAQKIVFICLNCRIFFGLSSYRTENSVHMFRLSNFLRSQFVPQRKHFISVKKNNEGNML